MKYLKNISMLALTVLLSVGLQAQKANLETVTIALKTYNKKTEKKDKRIHYLNEAKKKIDAASKNSTTANDPRMYLLYARTYLAIHEDKLGENGGPVIVDEQAIEKASEALINCHKTDDAKAKWSGSNEANQAIVGIAYNAQNIALDADAKEDYPRAVKYYQISIDLIPYDKENNIKRNNITIDGNLNSIAYAEYKAGMYDESKKHYHELIDRGYNDPNVYIDLYNLYLQIDKDTVKAIETIDRGRMSFDENKTLKYIQIDIYSKANKSEELFTILTDNIDLDPYNSENYLMRGKLHRSVGAKLKLDADTLKKQKKTEEAAKKMEASKKHVEEAVADYTKALEMDDQNLEAHSEIGEMYYLQGADIYDEANELGFNEQDKFDKLMVEAKEAFNKAIPSYETIYELSTDEAESGKAAQFLMELYLRTEQMDKYNKIKAEN